MLLYEFTVMTKCGTLAYIMAEIHTPSEIRLRIADLHKRGFAIVRTRKWGIC